MVTHDKMCLVVIGIYLLVYFNIYTPCVDLQKNCIEDKKHEIDDKLYARWTITKSLPLHHLYTNLTPFVQMF